MYQNMLRLRIIRLEIERDLFFAILAILIQGTLGVNDSSWACFLVVIKSCN